MWRSALKILFFLFIMNLVFTGTTDADMIVTKEITQNEWSATTLEFSGRDTASGTATNLLFNTVGIRPGGYQIKAIRLQKDGKMDFDYDITSRITAGDPLFCSNLSITIMENWQKKYYGKIDSMSVTRKMEESGKNDWVIILSLDSNDSQNSNKSCSFDLIFKTNGTGFSDIKSVENQVSSGDW